jgi:deoxyribose-phosphate aldolase
MQIESRTNPVRKIIHAALESAHREKRCASADCNDPLCAVHNESGLREVLSIDWSAGTAGGVWKSLRDDNIDLASLIDHTLLKPEATLSDIQKLCEEAVTHGFASVCINPVFVRAGAEMVHGTPVGLCTVIGFPLGATTTASKVSEAENVLEAGATEIDMVLPVGLLRTGLHGDVLTDIDRVSATAHAGGAICKVILETALLNEEDKVRAALLAKRAGADFLKTSTGFSTGGATEEDVSLLRAVAGNAMGVKAAGGIRTREKALAMIASGANRLGCSASVAILDQGSEN